MDPITLLIPPALEEVKASARADVMTFDLTRLFGRAVRVRVAESYADLEQRLLASDVELAWAPPSVCARVSGHAHAIFKAVRNGRSSYRAALLTRAGEADRVEELEGRRVVWTDPLSTAGYLLPDAWLRSRGIDPAVFFTERAFAGTYSAALDAVANGEADVTSVYVHAEDASDLHRVLAQNVDRSPGTFSVVAVTGEVGADGLVVGSALTEADARPIIERLESVTRDAHHGALAAFDADGLERARPDAYRSLVV